jgi:hypothetical protein
MSKKFVKPVRKKLVVRRPDNGRALPEDGDWVNWNSYWMRRKAEGSIVEASPKKKRAASGGNKEGND